MATLLLGLVFFLVWSRLTRRWPFAKAEEMAGNPEAEKPELS
ncbi:MAG: hypothetical protein AAB676_19565 [Verrucomicrobiota bacterium]